MESYGTNNFTFKYGIHTISIDYLCGHGPDSEIKIIALEIVFDIFGYLFKKLPFLRLRIGQTSFELRTKKLVNNGFNNMNFFDNNTSGDDLTEALKARQRIKYQKQNPQKLRIHPQFDQNQNGANNQDKINTSSTQENNITNQQQPQTFDQNQQPNGFIQDSIKSNQNPLERWIARRLFGFFLAILVRSAQIDSGLFTLKVGGLSLNIKDISIFYNRSATSIVSHLHFNEISITSDKEIPFKCSPTNESNENETINLTKDIDNSNNNNNDNDNDLNTNNNDYITNDNEKDQLTTLLRVPDISMTITSDTQSFKYFLGGMISQFRIKVDELNIDYSDGQVSVSSIQAQMYAHKDSTSKTRVEISQLFILLPVIDLYTKTVSATINDISLSLDSGKFVSGPILVTRNEQPFFSSHSMKYRKGKIDFEYLDATISTPLIIDLSLFKRFFIVFNEEIANDINRIRNFTSNVNSISRFESSDVSDTNLRVNAINDSTNNSLFSSTDSVNDSIINSNDDSSSLYNSSEMVNGFNDQSEIQNEIEMDIEKYDEKRDRNGDSDDIDESYDESRNEFESAYDLNEDSWTQNSESSSNYKFSVENESIPRSRSNVGSFRKRRRTLRKKQAQNFLVVNSPTAILRFALSDNHIMTYNMRQFTYSNYLITAKSFTLDASFTDSQHSSSSLNEELKNSSSKLAFIENGPKGDKSDDDNSNVKNYQQLIHRFCECHHASFNFSTPIIAFKCNTGNFFLTNEFAEVSFVQEFLALFRFLHNQTRIDQQIQPLPLLPHNESSNTNNNNNNNDNDNAAKIIEEEEINDDDDDENPLTKYVFSFDAHKLGIEMKVNSLVSKINRSNEAKRIAIEGLQIRQEKAIQMMNANLINDSNPNSSSSSFSYDDFEATSRKMLFDLYKSTITKIQDQKDDDLFYVRSKDLHLSFDGPKIKNKKQGIDELKRSVKFYKKKKKELFDKIKRRNKVTNFDEKYESYINEEEVINDETYDLNDFINTETDQTQDDVFNTKDEYEFDKEEFEEVVNKIGTFDCGLLNLNSSSISISSPRIGTLMTFKLIKTNGIMMIMKQKALKNDDLYHFPIHCDNKSIEFLIPRISHRTITVFNIDECLCNEAYFKYTAAMKELQQDFFFGTSLFRKHKFSFKRLEFFDNMRLRYRLKLSNMNIKSLDIDYNSKYDAYSNYPLFKIQLPNFKAVCDDNETFQLSSDNFYLKILNGLQFDYSFLLTMPSPSMKLKFVSYNPIYEDVLHKIRQKTKKKAKGATTKVSYNYNRDELLLLKCRCKKNPFFIPIHSYRMNDKSYDPYRLFRTHSFSIHFILNFDNSQNASVNLDYLQPAINAFLAKKSLMSAFVTPARFSNRHFCPKLSFVDFSINLPGILITMNRNRILSKINGDSLTLKFNNRSKQINEAAAATTATTKDDKNKQNDENGKSDSKNKQNDETSKSDSKNKQSDETSKSDSKNKQSDETSKSDSRSSKNDESSKSDSRESKKRRKTDRRNKAKCSSFSLDIGGKNMKFNATLDERNLYDGQISSLNINYEKGYSVDVNIGIINSEFSPRIINFLAYPPIVKINDSAKAKKARTQNSTALPLNLSLQPNSNSNSSTDKNSPNQQQQQQQTKEDDQSSSSYFPFAFPKYENRTELPTFDRDDQFQMLFSKRTIIIKIDSCSTTLRFNNNKTMQFKASTIRFEQRIIPKDDEYANNHRQSRMLDFDFNLCPPLRSVSAESLSVTTARSNQQLLFLESPYFAFSKATNLTYYQIIGSTLTICPSEEDFFFFIPTTKAFIDDLYTLHKERQRNEFNNEYDQIDLRPNKLSNNNDNKNNKSAALRAVISSSYLKQIVLKLVGNNDATTLGTLTADDIIIQIRRSHELLEIGQFLIRKISAVNELDDKDSVFKNVIETTKEPFLTLKYDKPPLYMKNSFIQSIRVMINPFKLRIDTSYIKRLNAEFPSASMLRVFILEGNGNGEEMNQSNENFDSNEVDLSKSKGKTKHSNSMTHSNSSHFDLISSLESNAESSGANYDDQIDQVKKKKKNKDKYKTASESDTENRKIEKKRQKKEKKERKKESKKLAKESLYNRALRLKNPFFCQHFNFAELPIEVSFRSFDDNNSPYLTSSNSSLSSNSKDNNNSNNNLTPTNLILDRNMQIGNLDIVDFYGDYKMLSSDISWHLKSSYFRSLSSLLLKKRKNSTMNPLPPKPDS